jgi:FlaA1/EpsC-like NDP-sugar epimerase
MKENPAQSTYKRPANSLLTLPRSAKQLLVVGVDVGLCVLTVWLAICLRFEAWLYLEGYQWLAVIASPALAVPLFAAFGLYRSVFRFVGRESLLALLRATSVYAVLYASIFTAIGFPLVPRTIGLLQPALLLLAVGAVRILARELLGTSKPVRIVGDNTASVLIYGAGDTGRQLAESLSKTSMRVVGFLDDNPSLYGGQIMGHHVWSPSDMESLVHTHGVRDVLLALPTVTRTRRTEIVKLLSRSRIAVRTLPRLADLAHKRVDADQLREVCLEDLLGRDSVVPDSDLMARNIRNKVVVVTGAGGSIGSELCRQILTQQPAHLILIELSEFALYTVLDELQKQMEVETQPGTRLTSILADVRDARHLRAVFASIRPETVFHAAAYKHVPLVEDNPVAAIQNNVFGTLNVARAAIDEGVSDVVLISTDKAVRPTNIMGATKRVAEMALQALAQQCQQAGLRTRLSMVRFGNVLGSSGSVVPKFKQQIQNGGPLTVTHPSVTRYFMTIPEAAQLVIQAAAMAADTAAPGPVYLLDMGDPVRIQDLARIMIQLSGLTERDADNPHGDIAIEFTGLRPGEKLYEELLISGKAEKTSNSKILRAQEQWIAWSQLEPLLKKLEQLDCGCTQQEVQRALKSCVPDFQPAATP